MVTKTTDIEDIEVKEVRNSTVDIDHVSLKQDNDIIILTIEQVHVMASVLNEIY